MTSVSPFDRLEVGQLRMPRADYVRKKYIDSPFIFLGLELDNTFKCYVLTPDGKQMFNTYWILNYTTCM